MTPSCWPRCCWTCGWNAISSRRTNDFDWPNCKLSVLCVRGKSLHSLEDLVLSSHDYLCAFSFAASYHLRLCQICWFVCLWTNINGTNISSFTTFFSTRYLVPKRTCWERKKVVFFPSAPHLILSTTPQTLSMCVKCAVTEGGGGERFPPRSRKPGASTFSRRKNGIIRENGWFSIVIRMHIVEQ